MENRLLKEYLDKGSLKKRSPDINRANSLINIAEITANAALKVSLNEENSVMIFRELYEALRQLGDAKLWKIGYEARQHEPSIRILMDAKLRDKLALNKLDRFRIIRHDANYRGNVITLNQAKEILEFWKDYSKEILQWVKL